MGECKLSMAIKTRPLPDIRYNTPRLSRQHCNTERGDLVVRPQQFNILFLIQASGNGGNGNGKLKLKTEAESGNWEMVVNIDCTNDIFCACAICLDSSSLNIYQLDKRFLARGLGYSVK